jgi:hypothetical protein
LPALTSEAVTRIRARLDQSTVVETVEILNEMLAERDCGRYVQDPKQMAEESGENCVLVAGEVGYAVTTAIRFLEGRTELRVVSGGGEHPMVRMYFDEAGFDPQSKSGFSTPQSFIGTPLTVPLAPPQGVEDIKWDGVRLLVIQAVDALRFQLAPLAVVGARIAVEEAVVSALRDLNVSEDDIPSRPWKREDVLFDDVPEPHLFAPMDQTATRSALSAMRTAGNDAAHTGRADDAHQNEYLIFTAIRAIASLSAAVDAHDSK